ncbi:portal protein [Bacillus testis]|uniref:portal protein n=1 Tax=Bacillus testis TaxID=1622072 RepID=UPI00067EBC0A|nr:portal protein [Bacillus testis]
MKKNESMLETASAVQNQYKEGLQYKKGYVSKWAEYERFKSGDQWPAPTNATRDLPRPVFNIIKQIINHKVASVMNENIRMVYTALDVEEQTPEFEAAEKFTRFSDATWERIKQDQLNEEALESGATTGPCIWHYYWDNSKQGGNKLKYQGEMEGEVIDPVNFFPGNPQNHRVQEQPYILITYRDLVKNVRELAKSSGVSKDMISLIVGDKETEDQGYDMAKKEMKDSDKTTVITKYWKENGQVYFMKVSGNIVVKPKTELGIKLYPVVVMQWERRKRSIFGVSDVEGLIPNQKSINMLMAMQLLSVQLTGWPKMIVDKNLVHQQITNTPGEVIHVNSGTQGSVNNALQYMNPGTMSNQASALVDAFLSYTREINGANESMLGEQKTGQLNATAIMLLQKAAGVPLESIKRRFYQAVEDIGLIWLEFFKTKYNTTRMVPMKDDDEEAKPEPFNGSEYADVDMSLKIDVGPSSSYSESLMMTSLDKLFDTQQITLEEYLRFAPKNVIPFKDRLLKSVQERMQQQQMMQQQQAQQQQMMQQEQQAQAAMQQQQTDMQAQQEAEANQPHPFDQLLAQLPKHQQEQFKKLPPEEQQAYMEAIMGPQQ